MSIIFRNDRNIAVTGGESAVTFQLAPRTRRQIYRDGCRPVGVPVGQRPYVHAEPHHGMRNQAWPLADEELDELRSLLHEDAGTAVQTDLYLRALRAGQITVANLYASCERIEEPTEKEAEIMLELSFRHGHDYKTWIVSTLAKKTFTVGTSFKRPYKFKEHLRGDWLHGVVQHKAGEGETDWIVIDLDRHSGIIPKVLYLQRLRELRRLLDEEGFPAVLQVNPKNGSLHLWIPFRAMPYGLARNIIASWRQKLPWLEGVEIFPDNLHQVLLPLRPDKVLVCDKLVPRVKRHGYSYNKITQKKRRYTKSAYSCAHVWKWLQDPKSAPWETWEGFVADACANEPDLEVPDQDAGEAATEGEGPRKARKLRKLVRTGQGSLGPLKGRWLQLLVDTYVNGVRPPDNTIGQIEQGVIRHCMVGKGLTAEQTKTVLKKLRGRLPDKSFSDRLVYDEAELDRANEYLLNDPLAYLPDPERSRATWTKVEAYCVEIGFDISEPDTWKLPERRRPRLELPQSARILALTAMIAMKMGCPLEKAKWLLERVAHHVLHKHYLPYSLMCKFLEEHGLPGTNDRASKVFSVMRDSGFLVLRHKYYCDPVSGYRHANYYVLSPVATEGEEEAEVTTISLFPSFHCNADNDLDLLLIRCQRCEEALRRRLARLFDLKRAA